MMEVIVRNKHYGSVMELGNWKGSKDPRLLVEHLQTGFPLKQTLFTRLVVPDNHFNIKSLMFLVLL